MKTTEQPTLPATDAPDAEWLAQVREDAGRWWSTWEPDLHTVLSITGTPFTGWQVWHDSGDKIGGDWPSRDAARLSLWLAAEYLHWNTLSNFDRLGAEQRADLAALERRLRTALGLAVGR